MHVLANVTDDGLKQFFDGRHKALADFWKENDYLVFHGLIGLLIRTTLVRQALAPVPTRSGGLLALHRAWSLCASL